MDIIYFYLVHPISVASLDQFLEGWWTECNILCTQCILLLLLLMPDKRCSHILIWVGHISMEKYYSQTATAVWLYPWLNMRYRNIIIRCNDQCCCCWLNTTRHNKVFISKVWIRFTSLVHAYHNIGEPPSESVSYTEKMSIGRAQFVNRCRNKSFLAITYR